MRNIQQHGRTGLVIPQQGSAIVNAQLARAHFADAARFVDAARFALAIALTMLMILLLVSGSAVDGQEQAKRKTRPRPKTSQPQQAWEYWAYNVRAWVVFENDFEIEQVDADVQEHIRNSSYVTDTSAWKIEVERAPDKWNWRFIRLIDQPEQLAYLTQKKITATDEQNKKIKEKQEAAATAGKTIEDNNAPKPEIISPLTREFSALIDSLESERVDKFMLVRIRYRNGVYEVSAREFDLRTRIWGAKTQISCGNPARVGETAYRALANAFMPLANIDKAYDKQNTETNRTERWTRSRVRALGLAKITQVAEDGSLQIVPNTSSPVWVRADDILMPVIRRLNNDKAFESAKVVGWTFLVIQNQDGPQLECLTQSRDRVPLIGRSGTKIQKLGLVIRPPNRPTKITMYAKVIPGTGVLGGPDPLAEYEVFSRSIFHKPGQPNDLIGKTDYFGTIDVPPSEYGLRLLLIKSGYRPLAKLPVVPGLYDSLEIELPNDEDRLRVEGIVRGLQNQVLDLSAQRKLIIRRMQMKIDKGQIAEAAELHRFFRSLDSAQRMKEKINMEKASVIVKDPTQRSRINGMFDKLTSIVDTYITPDEDAQADKMINDARSSQRVDQ